MGLTVIIIHESLIIITTLSDIIICNLLKHTKYMYYVVDSLGFK